MDEDHRRPWFPARQRSVDVEQERFAGDDAIDDTALHVDAFVGHAGLYAP
jgi:hypothetical protein